MSTHFGVESTLKWETLFGGLETRKKIKNEFAFLLERAEKAENEKGQKRITFGIPLQNRTILT